MLRLIHNELAGDSGFPDRDKMPSRIIENIGELDLWK